MCSNGGSLMSSTRPYEPTSLRASKLLPLDRGARDRPRHLGSRAVDRNRWTEAVFVSAGGITEVSGQERRRGADDAGIGWGGRVVVHLHRSACGCPRCCVCIRVRYSGTHWIR